MKQEKWLIGLQGFNAITAIAGGIGLMAGWVVPGPEYLSHTDFPSFYFPGVLLLCVVGGGALLATLALIGKIHGARLLNLLAAVIMLFWIIGEVVSIREFHFLQVIYIITSFWIIYLVLVLKSIK